MGDWDRYRRLDEGEIIMEGDEVDVCNDGWRDDPQWVPASHGIGTAAPCPDYPSHRVYRRLKEIDRLRAENERLRDETLKAVGKCRWNSDGKYLFSPCTKEAIRIPDDEWVYCPWCGGMIEYEEE